MSPADRYYHEAKQAGYRSRASFKLRQLDEKVDLLSPGAVVLDLGAAPGGWLQIAAEEVGSNGTVIGVDRTVIKPLEGYEATVETMQADLTDDHTLERLQDRFGKESVDVVLSDMAPDMTGDYTLDHARSVHLARQASIVADAVLKPGGDFLVKVFQGRDLDEFKADLEAEYDYVRTTSPPASRDASSEVYLIARGLLRGPVRPGDTREVEIDSTGDEGDGVALIEGYTVFVPGTEVGDKVRIRMTDCKPSFGFAEVID